jgi:iron(III) transport system ATP-binding protein
LVAFYPVTSFGWSMSFLTLDAVSKRYGAVSALNDVSLSIASGGRTAIVGPSGSGKTTLLRLVAGFDAPDAGRIVLARRTLANGPVVVPAHRRDVGVVMQDGALFPHLNVGDNIGFGLARRDADRAQVIAELSDMVGLDRSMLRRKPDALSGGQQQRVALARALARRPKLMLLDEPFSALDTSLRAAMRKMVADLLMSAGVTTILVTHDQAEALSFADHLAIMGGGMILQAGSPRDLYLQPATPMIAAFLGDAVILPATLCNGTAHCALGEVKIHDANRCGHADIMLRPEQILLLDDGQPNAKIINVEFAGASSIVTAIIGDEKSTRIVLSQPSSRAFAPNVNVSIMVTGSGHVFPSGKGVRSPEPSEELPTSLTK